MADEVLNPSFNKTEVKLPTRKNVIPITSINDLGTVVGDIQNQLTLLLEKLNDEVSPEFRALMEGYVNKANESEELKVNLENIKLKHEEFKAEIKQVRETNRNLINELQSTREILRNLESQLNGLQSVAAKTEEDYKDKIKILNLQISEYENKVSTLEEENIKIKQGHEELRQELLDQSFKYKQGEQETLIERDSLRKQVEEFELLLKEQQEQIDYKSKELEYKDAFINQLIKQSTTGRLKAENHEEFEDNQKKKRKIWPFG